MNRNPGASYDPICIHAMEYILEHGDATATDMKEYASWSPLNARMKRLCADGLVEYYLPDKGRKTVHYILTPKGRMFAQIMKVSHDIYNGKIDLEDEEIVEKLQDLVTTVSKERCGRTFNSLLLNH